MLAVTGMLIKADKSPNPAAISYSGCSLKQPLNCNSHSDSDIQMGECWSNARVMKQKSAFFVPFKPGEKSYHSEGGPYGTCTAYACFPSESDMQEESNLANFCFFWDGKDHTVLQNGGLSRRGLFERDGTASDDGDPSTSQNMTATTADPTTADPTTADPTTADPTTADPTTADPTTADPTTADPTTADPTTADPTTADPTTADPTTTDPTTTNSTTTDPTTADPTTTDPTAVDPSTGTAPDPTMGNNATSTGTKVHHVASKLEYESIRYVFGVLFYCRKDNSFFSIFLPLKQLYTDKISGDEMFSDGYDFKEIDDVVYEVDAANIVVQEGDVDIGANPSAEEQQEALENGGQQVINIVHSFRLQSTTFDKKSYLTYLKGYMKAIKTQLQTDAPERVEVFEKKAQEFAKKVLGNFKDYDFYTGESGNPDGMVALLNFREDGVTPFLIFWKDGLKDVKI
ncbi:hypothetical protein L7F22_016567 [Adiantum nelumboides]|nr:hypothetical protein [Adiantum nelumboides]